MTAPCPSCAGAKTRPGKFLGSLDEPCETCRGQGIIEIPEPPLSAWQQQVVTLLGRIAEAGERLAEAGERPAEAGDRRDREAGS